MPCTVSCCTLLTKPSAMLLHMLWGLASNALQPHHLPKQPLLSLPSPPSSPPSSPPKPPKLYFSSPDRESSTYLLSAVGQDAAEVTIRVQDMCLPCLSHPATAAEQQKCCQATQSQTVGLPCRPGPARTPSAGSLPGWRSQGSHGVGVMGTPSGMASSTSCVKMESRRVTDQ